MNSIVELLSLIAATPTIVPELQDRARFLLSGIDHDAWLQALLRNDLATPWPR